MQGRSYNVLMVDDDEDDIFAVRRGMTTTGKDIGFASVSSADALFNHLNTEAPSLPDLILLDVNMPRMNGFEVLSQLKSTEHWAGIPVMVLSTSEHDADRMKAQNLGAVSFSTKFSSMKGLNTWIKSVEQFLRAQP